MGQFVLATNGATRMTTSKQYDALNRLTQISSAPAGRGRSARIAKFLVRWDGSASVADGLRVCPRGGTRYSRLGSLRYKGGARDFGVH